MKICRRTPISVVALFARLLPNLRWGHPRFGLFYYLELDPITLIFDLDLRSTKTYQCAEHEVCVSDAGC